MKITKFPQSCILIQNPAGNKLLIDPSKVKFDNKFLDYWKTANAILITHRHGDHCYAEILEKLNIPIYSTQEVADFYPNLRVNIIKEGDNLNICGFHVRVVKAVHGYMLPAGEIKENVGFIIDYSNNKKLYITSDTIRFKNDYKANTIFADIAAFDASMNLWGAVATMKEVGADYMIVAHQDDGKMMYSKAQIEDYLNSQNVNFIMPEILETFEIK